MLRIFSFIDHHWNHHDFPILPSLSLFLIDLLVQVNIGPMQFGGSLSFLRRPCTPCLSLDFRTRTSFLGLLSRFFHVLTTLPPSPRKRILLLDVNLRREDFFLPASWPFPPGVNSHFPGKTVIVISDASLRSQGVPSPLGLGESSLLFPPLNFPP